MHKLVAVLLFVLAMSKAQVDAAQTYTIANQKTFATQMIAARCTADANTNKALDCSYLLCRTERNVQINCDTLSNGGICERTVPKCKPVKYKYRRLFELYSRAT
ncbi:hypothetical protein DOY81_001491 [Sarcophaga bullata]|nr:hypothetical protein DOY81_001491 [Sarcophaga bullata]